MIECPECGQKISDKAPTCPNCGVEIAGKVVRCKHCGGVYLSEYEKCPNCNKQQNNIQATSDNIGKQRQGNTKKKKNSLQPYIITIIVALMIAAAGLYIYKSKRSEKEQQAYEMAMKSTDPILLRNFLNNFSDASQEHIDSIQARLDMLNMIDEEWENVKATKSKIALQDYLAKYPSTNHKAEIDNLLDSIDWQQALKSNNNDMYQQYINDHPYGKYAEDAREKINQLKAKTIQPEERQMVVGLVRKFFLSVNKRDEAGMMSTLSPQMTSFIGMLNPSEADVKRWMNRLYKEGVTEIIWRLNNDYSLNKREVGDNAYEYTAVFSATEDIKYSDEAKSATEHYKIKATITPDGELSAMSINKILNSQDKE